MWVTCEIFVSFLEGLGGCAPKVGGTAPKRLGGVPPTIDKTHRKIKGKESSALFGPVALWKT